MNKPPPPGSPPRRYPRVDLRVSARLTVTGDPFRTFEATLATRNISVGGIFFDSTFFLKLGMQLDVELELPFGAPGAGGRGKDARPVRVRGNVVRVESSKDRSGFALKFTEYFDGSDVVLANFFLAPVLREFITSYAKKHRLNPSPEYIANTADVLAAWELEKANQQPDWTSVLTKTQPEKRQLSTRGDEEADRVRWASASAKMLSPSRKSARRR